MSFFEQTLINNYVFSETDNKVSGGAPITELVASHENRLNGGNVGGGNTNKNQLANKKHLSVPVGLVMVSHTEYLYPAQRFVNPTIQEPMFDNLIKNIEDDIIHLQKSKSKSLKHRQEKQKKQSKRMK